MGRTIDIALPARKLNGHGPPVERSQNGGTNGAAADRERHDAAQAASRLDTDAYARARPLARDSFYRRALAVGDVAAAAFALLVGMLALEDTLPEPLLIAALPLVVVASKVSGLYDHDENLLRRTTLEEIPVLFQAATAYSLLVLVGGELVVTSDLGRSSLVGLWALLLVSLTVTRIGLRWLLGRLGRVERCLVLGDAAAASRLSRSFDLTSSVRAEVVGRLPLEHREGGLDGGPALAAIEDVLAQEQIDRVVIASRRGDSELMVDAVRLVKGLGVKVSVLPGLFEAVGSSASVDEVDGLLLLGLPGEGLTKSARALKRGVDLGLACAAVVILAPVIAVTALVVAAKSPGSVLLRERFRDRDGWPFEMLSFRTGLRRFALHALPRLVNVLRGDLSFVGPHPRPLRGEATVDGATSGDLRPGLTGLWRLRGSAQSPEELPTLDYLYAANWSLWLDIRILLRTAVALARPRRTVAPRSVGARRTRRNGRPSLRNGRPTVSNGHAPANDGYPSASNGHPPANGRSPANGHAPASNGHTAASNGHLSGNGHNGRRNGRSGSIGRENGAAASNGNGTYSGNGSALAPSHPVPLDRTPARRKLPVRPVRLSAVVPATNGPRTLEQCLGALRGARDAPDEIVVVEDGDIGGPAAARNEGARRASGDVLVFVDADVVVHRDAFSRIRELFERDPELTAAFGSYDDGLATNGRVATFRNVLHHHVHHSKPGAADTFWSGLGAVRRRDFLDCGGFDPERFPHPSVEDIDLGMRLSDRGARILLNPNIQCTHLKDWHLREMLFTDFSRRAVPWVGLLAQRPQASRSTLNLSWRHRLSAGLSLLGLGALVLRRPWVLVAVAASMFGLNRSFYVLLARRYGLRTFAAGVVLHVLHHLVSIAGVPVGVIARLAEARGGRRLGNR